MSALARGNDSRLYRFFFPLSFSRFIFFFFFSFLQRQLPPILLSVLISATGHYFVPKQASLEGRSGCLRRRAETAENTDEARLFQADGTNNLTPR